jgi:Raf kinase inhibitor-like YbhB/YbcL family protein
MHIKEITTTVGRSSPAKAMTLRSAAFSDGAVVPVRFTCDGANVSPPLEWSAAPEGTRAFALVMDDPDAPHRTWVHWTVYDIPAATRELPEHVPASDQAAPAVRQGRNDFGGIGYGGPCPPPGGAHRYYWRLFALDAPLKLASGATRGQLDRAMAGHVLARAELMGRYRRDA